VKFTIQEIESVGFKLISNHKLWCHFRGFGFDLHINLDTTTEGNLFNFKAYKDSFKGNFRVRLNSLEELRFILKATDVNN
jgi:hypothetical protein